MPWQGNPVSDSVDFGALRRVFTAPAKPSASDADRVHYNGEAMPRWLARDLMQERAAIMEYCGGMARAEAERLTALGLGQKTQNPA